MVLTADGTSKPISEVEVGDLVLATDPETGRTEAREVTDLIVGEGVKSMVAVTVDTPGPDGVVMATALHPFWDEEDREWVDATDLTAGDLLLAPDGDLLPVAGTREVGTCPDGLQPHRRRHPHVLCVGRRTLRCWFTIRTRSVLPVAAVGLMVRQCLADMAVSSPVPVNPRSEGNLRCYVLPARGNNSGYYGQCY